MEWLAIVTIIVKLIGLAEELFGDNKGAVKKASVTSFVQTAVEGGISVSTGGQKETWQNVAPLVSTFVDTAVGIANLVKPGVVEDENRQISAG